MNKFTFVLASANKNKIREFRQILCERATDILGDVAPEIELSDATMFELNKHYGWSKFIVVVPSIAIREGVKKSFEITQDHFMLHYGKKARFFIYDSSNLQKLDSFSQDSGINVMIINSQAFAASLKEDGKSKDNSVV